MKKSPLLLVGVTLVLVTLLGLLATTQANAAKPDPLTVKTVTNQSVIRTSDPVAAKAALHETGLREVRTTPLPNGDVFITIDAPPSSPAALGLQLRLRDDPGFTLLPNYQYRTTLTPNDPLYNNQWNLPKIDAPAAWDTTTGSSSVTIAILDTGVLFRQGWQGSPDCPLGTPCAQNDLPESRKWTNSGEVGVTAQEGSTPNCTSRGLPLDKSCNNLDDDSNGYVDDWQGWDFMGGWRGSSAVCPNNASPTTYQNPTYPNYIDYDNDPQPYSCDSPSHQSELNRNHYNGTCQAFESACYVSHGTAVASVAASSGNNNLLVAGVDWNTKIMPLRVLDGYGSGGSVQIAAAVEYATAMGADVINLSLAVFSGSSCTVTDSILENALANAVTNGVTIVAAAGNTGTAGVCYPARSNKAIAVGATDSNDNRANFSSYGPELDVVAPGASVPAALAPNKATNYALYSLGANGTSFAAPHAAGVASLLLSVQPSLTPAEVRDTLIQNTNKVPSMGGQSRTDTYGYGRINARYTVLQAQNLVYEPLKYPRDMYLTVATKKTDLLSVADTGTTFPKGRIVRFESKVQVNGEWYLRTAYDTDRNNHLGIPLSKLSNLPNFASLDRPRDMVLKEALHKTNILTDSNTGGLLSKGRVMRFQTKVQYNGEWYLRTEYDTSHGSYYAVPISKLRELPSYSAMVHPRDMRLNVASRKTNLLSLEDTGATYANGRVIRFTSKTIVDGVAYLRTQYDTDRGYHLGIPSSKLKEL